MINESDDWYEKEQLHFAAAQGNLERVKALLTAGYPINAFDDALSRTPLHHAARENHAEVVRYLIDAGADVNAHEEEKIGDTVLKHIAVNGSLEIIKILIDAGADPTIPGWMQLTALDEIRERKKHHESRKGKKQVSAERRKEAEAIDALLYRAAKRLHPGWPRLKEFIP